MSNSTDAVIVDTSRSPYAHLKPVPFNQISLEDGFWQSRYSLNQSITIPTQYQLLESTGRLDNFRRVTRQVQKPFQGYVFNDSDVYKWLEAASLTLNYHQDDEANDRIDQVISLIGKAQDKDGYVNTYFSLEKIRERWMNLQEMHELYCAGHLIQAAIAHQRATGEDRLMKIATRLADHVCNTFGPSQVEGACGHPEIEMALVELYRATGDDKYLQQAILFIDRRGRGLLGSREYLLDHIQFRKMEQITGHAVRAMYLCAGAADVTLETGEVDLIQALERLWMNMVTKKMYVTGGVGARYDGEAIGLPYELPNTRAYAETCAAIANLMWNWRMLQMKGMARYADLLEWTLYNAVLPGIALDASHYFYVNPLSDDGSHRRVDWFECACCPPNVARTIAALPGYLYSTSSEGIWLHLYAASKAKINLQTGQQVTLEQATSYPWEGRVILRIADLSPADPFGRLSSETNEFSIHLRIPGWLTDQYATMKINGRSYRHHTSPGSYLEIKREWKKGDTIELVLSMAVRYLQSHPMVVDNYRRIAVARGPLLYCLEAVDNPHHNLSEIRVNPSLAAQSEHVTELLCGITRLRLHGSIERVGPEWEDHLYRPRSSLKAHSKDSTAELISIPYFAWANREPGAMAIWHLWQE